MTIHRLSRPLLVRRTPRHPPPQAGRVIATARYLQRRCLGEGLGPPRFTPGAGSPGLGFSAASPFHGEEGSPWQGRAQGLASATSYQSVALTPCSSCPIHAPRPAGAMCMEWRARPRTCDRPRSLRGLRLDEVSDAAVLQPEGVDPPVIRSATGWLRYEGVLLPYVDVHRNSSTRMDAVDIP